MYTIGQPMPNLRHKRKALKVSQLVHIRRAGGRELGAAKQKLQYSDKINQHASWCQTLLT